MFTNRRAWGWRFGVVLLTLGSLVQGSVALAQAASAREARLAARYAMAKPEGPGPFPSVILVPGCQGFDRPQWKQRYEAVSRDLLGLGFAVIRADYLAASEAPNCELVMDPAEAAGDILVAARHLRAQPFIKADRIQVMSWSFGGGLSLGVLERLDPADRAGPPLLAGVVAYFPYLTLRRTW
jgi:dienelactone hydrolase